MIDFNSPVTPTLTMLGGLALAVVIGVWAAWKSNRKCAPRHIGLYPMPRIPESVRRAERQHPVMKIRAKLRQKARHV